MQQVREQLCERSKARTGYPVPAPPGSTDNPVAYADHFDLVTALKPDSTSSAITLSFLYRPKVIIDSAYGCSMG